VKARTSTTSKGAMSLDFPTAQAFVIIGDGMKSSGSQIDPRPAERRTMTAIVQKAWGTDPATTLRVAEVDRPTINNDEVLVEVRASSVDQGTVHCMTGQPYAMRFAGFGIRRPKAMNPGRAFAGTVVSVGSAVNGVSLGDQVYGTCDGSFAEFVAVQPARLARKPANLSFTQAAAAPISGSTALQAVRKAQVQRGQHILILGASGGVGTFAVQIAKAAGAEVTGVCRTSKADLVRSLGADHVIDYTQDDPTRGDRRYDVILDIGGNRKLLALRRALTEQGALVIVGGETGGRLLGGFDRSLRAVLFSPFVKQTLAMLTSRESGEDLDALGSLVEAGKVTPAVDRTFPLRETAMAIRAIQEGDVRGKIVIKV
jgi:NADPH:quinone reductase-like Zn-dependent oxidoreductase